MIPPTGKIAVPGGSTARHALTTAGAIISAGNALTASAPAAKAAKASLGVAAPGRQVSPSAFARAMTAGFVFGVTMRSPPASATASTSAGVSTVPAPTKTRAGAMRRMAAMLFSGCGELSGTSINSKSSSSSASATSAAASGAIPRRIATSGSFAIAA